MTSDNIVKLEKHPPLVLFQDDGNWTNFEHKLEFLELVTPINGMFSAHPDTTQVISRPISCYKNAQILKVDDKTWDQDWSFHFLYNGENYRQLGHIDENIFIINNKMGLNLNKDSVVDYLKLFYYFEALDDFGSRLLLTSFDGEFSDFLYYANELEERNLREKIIAPKVGSFDSNKEIDVECVVIVGTEFHRVKHLVNKIGEIAIVESEFIHGHLNEAY